MKNPMRSHPNVRLASVGWRMFGDLAGNDRYSSFSNSLTL